MKYESCIQKVVRADCYFINSSSLIHYKYNTASNPLWEEAKMLFFFRVNVRHFSSLVVEQYIEMTKL